MIQAALALRSQLENNLAGQQAGVITTTTETDAVPFLQDREAIDEH
ncbi:hypothetical protein [uncultured Arthrobacter sp.]|nr:hypothetical protein [uncultured Arthrobacter sp.]